MWNNLGMVLMKLHEPTEEEQKQGQAQQDGENDPKQLFGSTLQKKRPKNANRNKALERAKEAFGKAIDLDVEYIKPHFYRMKIYEEEEEYEDAVRDAKCIEELDPKFKYENRLIHRKIEELERLKKEKFDKMKDEVMGGLKSLGNMFLGNFGMSVDNFQTV